MARFSANPQETHGKALKWQGRYLNHTRDKGIIVRQDPTRGFEVYVDADFCGNFVPHQHRQIQTQHTQDQGSSSSRHVVPFTGNLNCRWNLRYQRYQQRKRSLLACRRHCMQHFRSWRLSKKELRHAGFPLLPDLSAVKCRLFEDNNGAVELATMTKIRPRTR